MLRGYDDLRIIDFMNYGWPAGYESTSTPVLGLPNHSSGLKHPRAIKDYLLKELDHNAIMGPFPSPPFQWHRSNPMMVRPKKEKDKFRVILDMSFPLGSSVNSHIPRMSFDGAPYKLKLPTALDLAEHIARKGPGCYMYKLDVPRAYRQLPIDPLDWPLTGIEWDGEIYIDKSVPFGLRHGAMFCERITTAICYSAKTNFDAAVEAYIDDMGGVSINDLVQAELDYRNVCSTVVKLGLNLALDKCVGPSRVMSWTGTTFNSVTMTMKIDDDKIVETLAYAEALLDRTDISLGDMETFIGKIQHCLKFCPGGRRFLNRVLQMRREMNECDTYELTVGAPEDIKWFIAFLQEFNGQAVIRSQYIPSVVIYIDACLTGAGAVWVEERYTSYEWPAFMKAWEVNINDLEMFNLLVTLRKWKNKMKGKTCLIYCDNNTSVLSMTSGRASNDFMAGCLREMWWLCCTNDIFLTCEHVAGKLNEVAD